MTIRERKLMRIVKKQQRVIDTLSNKKILKGLNSAMKDFKEGNYTILTK